MANTHSDAVLAEILRVLRYIAEHQPSGPEACAALGISRSTLLRYMTAGRTRLGMRISARRRREESYFVVEDFGILNPAQFTAEAKKVTNHPNRGTKNPAANPSPDEVRAAREAAGLTQTQAASLVHTTCRAWQQWEAEVGTAGNRRMHPAFWELFRLKTGKPPSDQAASTPFARP